MLTKKGAATRQRIVDAAAEEIRDRGINAVTLDDVGRRSGTGKSCCWRWPNARPTG